MPVIRNSFRLGAPCTIRDKSWYFWVVGKSRNDRHNARFHRVVHLIRRRPPETVAKSRVRSKKSRTLAWIRRLLQANQVPQLSSLHHRLIWKIAPTKPEDQKGFPISNFATGLGFRFHECALKIFALLSQTAKSVSACMPAQDSRPQRSQHMFYQ